MKEPITRLFILASIILMATGCKEEDSSLPPSLNEAEHYMGCTLSSISSAGDSICMIGSETGDIYIYDTRSETVSDTLHTGTDRIYKVAVEHTPEGTFHIAGVRNMGLMIYKRLGNRLTLHKHLTMSGGRSDFSVYDFTLYNGRIYAATSHGLMYKDCGNSSTKDLVLAYPHDKKGDIQPLQTVALLRRGRYIYAASAEGLVKYDTRYDKTADIMHRDRKFTSMISVGDKIHALAGDVLYIYGPDGREIRKHDIVSKANIYFFANGIHYFISDDKISVVRDEDIDKHDKYKTVYLRRNVRTGCHNIVTGNNTSPHTLLITENALFRIPIHLDIFNTDGTTTAACPGDGGSYFVTNNSLFMKKDSTNEAVRLADLPKTDHISNIMIYGNTLFYTNGNTELKKKKITGSYIINRIFGPPSTVYTSPRGMTDVGMGNDGTIYIGIRDSIVLYKNGTIKAMENIGLPYVNRFETHGDSIYSATLNNGIIYGCGTKLRIMNHSNKHRFIKDMAFASFSDKPCLLTNHYLFSPSDKDSVEANGFRRLLTADGETFYALMEQGIRKFAIDKNGIRHIGDTLLDIRFSPSLSFAHSGKIYAGTPSLGMLEIDPKSGKAQWIKFNHSVYNLDYKTIIFIMIIVGIAVCFFLWHGRRKKADLKAYVKWENIKKEIEKINPGQPEIMAPVLPGVPEAMEKLCEKGRRWLEGYYFLKKEAALYKKLSLLTAFSLIDRTGAIGNDIGKLSEALAGNDFNLDECNTIYESIKTALHDIDADDMKKHINGMYEECKVFTEKINEGFGERLKGDIGKIRYGFFDDMTKALTVMVRIDKMADFLPIARQMAIVSKLLDSIKNNNANSRTDLNTIRKELENNLVNLYVSLANDNETRFLTGFKPTTHDRKYLQLTGKEKALLLMMVNPETNWEQTKIIYNINSEPNETNTKIVNNLRTTYSKVKGNVMAKKETIKQMILYNQDSHIRYFKKFIDHFAEK